jgi:hypothetical protein
MIEPWHIIVIILIISVIALIIFSYLFDCIEDLRIKCKVLEDRLRGAEERMRKANQSVLFPEIKYPGVIDD